jgi:predicted phage replisome organizer
MSDGKYYWLKLKRDFFKRHDIHILNGMEYGREVVLFYIKLMLESIDHEGELRFSERLPYSNSMLANLTDTPESIVDTSMEVLQDFKLIEIDENGTIILPKVMEMIGFETDWAKKKREYRDKKGQSEDNERTDRGQSEDNVLPMSDKSIEIRDKRLEIRDKSIERESNTLSHFEPPTVEEVYLYCEGRHNGIDAQRFVDYYTARGWKNITDWKAQIRVWENREDRKDIDL